MGEDKEFKKRVKEYQVIFDNLKKEISKTVIGQTEMVEALFKALIGNGHVLIEGVPGIAKTLLIRSLSKAVDCDFSRIQFTADLLPTDIVGITAYEASRGFYVIKGPIFSNFVLADEINRSPPKVQSALLEAMAEKQATIGKETFELSPPFFVLATQNPLENLGTYELPEAQLDRFLFKLFMDYPNLKDEELLLDNNINTAEFESYNIKPVLDKITLYNMQQDVKKIFSNDKIKKYIVKIIDATRNPSKYKIKLGKYLEWGASPRGSISLYIASKANALLNGKIFVTPSDVKEVAHDVLRHRILVNYEGQSENIKTDDIISEILDRVPVP